MLPLTLAGPSRVSDKRLVPRRDELARENAAFGLD
jgi:hypothetical protein